MKKFFSDFQTFISRGNVIDMAVGVIVGAAFTAIVNSMVKDLINPVLGVLIGSQDFSNFFVVLSMPEGYTGPMSYDALTKAGAAVLGYGAFFTAVFHFLLMAFVVFSLVRCVNKIRAATEAKLLVKKKQEEAQAAVAAKAASQAEASRVSKEIELLTEIRDLLKKQA
ncbi:MAG: large conductance mechanosensitive channel protein MscL [Candidatus Aphodousia sp.]|nr:large conductance mechanosensitive channel protein MscL [Sutterella sp.]MDY2899231.1 large conductance mechanosensitive channel protein MscL [Candidatus Aphodousia sp.]